MGFTNRDYYRDSRFGRGWSSGDMTPVVKYLIIANVVVFLLQIFVVSNAPPPAEDNLDEMIKQVTKDDPIVRDLILGRHVNQKVPILQSWLELDTQKVVYSGQIWRLLTHAFCHDRFGIFHILFNMIFLYWFGCTLEGMYGSREFLLFYLTSAIVAALAFVALDLYTGSSVPAIGASGAVMAVAVLYTMHFPYEIIYVCWFFPMQMRFVMLLYVIWDLHPVLLSLSGDRVFTGIAHAAHLGGAAFGFLYYHYGWRLEPLTERISWPSWRWRRRPQLRIALGTYPEAPEPRSDSEMDQLDRLLQKIYDSGQASLTEEERAMLFRASERIKNRTR
jgi:membrane associated rhomboid family serine protease